MTYKGHVANGVIVLDEDVTLPEGMSVDITPPKLPPGVNPNLHPFAGVIPAGIDVEKARQEYLEEKYK